MKCPFAPLFRATMRKHTQSTRETRVCFAYSERYATTHGYGYGARITPFVPFCCVVFFVKKAVRLTYLLTYGAPSAHPVSCWCRVYFRPCVFNKFSLSGKKNLLLAKTFSYADGTTLKRLRSVRCTTGAMALAYALSRGSRSQASARLLRLRRPAHRWRRSGRRRGSATRQKGRAASPWRAPR